jgi:hypothetical protein
MNDISIDLETFDSAPDASLAAIGAVSTSGNVFYRVVNDPGGSWSPKTMRWHATQEGVAENLGATEEAVPLETALQEFADWLGVERAHQEGGARLWTHATFDMPVLASAYKRAGIRTPWHHRNCRDLRTLYDLTGGRPDLVNTGAHHALRDAVYQLEEVQVCLARMVV